MLYAIIAEQNIAKLFAAALVPGLLAALLLLHRDRAADAAAAGARARRAARALAPALATLSGVVPVLAIFLVVLGGIYGGVFTATEGGGDRRRC